MDRTEAVAEQLRVAHEAVAVLGEARAPTVGTWLGPAADAAHAALHDLDGALRGARHCAHEWLSAVRRAASDG